MSSTTVAIVIPTLDEQAALEDNLPRLIGIADELVISDGGSRDQTTEIARRFGVRIVSGSIGRGPQLNRGAHATSSRVLLFLHADTQLPAGAIARVRHAIGSGSVGGGFDTKFSDDRLIYRFGSAMVWLRTRFSRTPLGDQAQFATREAFDQIGGFKDWPILEDLDFIRRLRRVGKLTVLPGPALTSARRYVEGGPVRTLVNNWWIWSLYMLGVPPARLAKRYRQVR